jgi:multidrug efflux pump subunit AcrB
VLPGLRANYPGLTWSFEGGNAEMREAMSALWGWFGLAMFVIYALLAVAFRRYVQPLIVMIAIPFGIIGAVARPHAPGVRPLAHQLHGRDRARRESSSTTR